MKLHLPSQSGVTVVENIFIDQYMPKANGEFVKLYLYLLRCAAAGKELSLSSIADVFDHTEGDVKRALAYWEKLHLLKLQYDGGGKLCDILFLDGDPNRETAASSETDSAPKTEVSVSVPEKSSLSRERKKALAGQEEIRQLIFIAEQYFFPSADVHRAVQSALFL